MVERELTVVVYHEEDGFVAQCLDVNVASDGDTEQEALANVREALELYFEDDELGQTNPVDQARVAKLRLQYA
jgi:predicted RNase H-like HicB family nuclease